LEKMSSLLLRVSAVSLAKSALEHLTRLAETLLGFLYLPLVFVADFEVSYFTFRFLLSKTP
jgi:hypothetical protein